MTLLAVFLALGLLQSAPATPDLADLVREARSELPEFRHRALAALAARGPEGLAALKPLVQEQLVKLDARVTTLLKEPMRLQHPIVVRLRALAGAELPARRAAALQFIRDEGRFTKDHAAGAEMQRLVDAVAELALRPAETFRTKVKELDALATEAEELSSYGPLVEVKPPDGVASGKALLQRFSAAAAADELGVSKAQLDRNHKVLDWLPTAPWSATAAERRVMELTNAHRLLLGLSALEFDERLVRTARSHSREMGELGYFAHESPTKGRTSPSDRAHLYGYGAGCAENIASHGSADAAFQAWLLSPGHHRNIVGQGHEQLGVGFWDHKGRSNFTMNLGSGDSLRGRTPKEPWLVWLVQRSRTKDDDLAGWRKLLLQAQASKLVEETQDAARHILLLAPDDVAARKAAGKTP